MARYVYADSESRTARYGDTVLEINCTDMFQGADMIVVIDPLRLRALKVSLDDVREAIRSSNLDVGGRTVEVAETEFMIRGRGYLKRISRCI